MSNPGDLTKTQLKEELVARGVEIPSGKLLKSNYIDLYNAHVNQDRHDFSSDDNVQVTSSSSKRSSRISKKNLLYSTIPETQQVQSSQRSIQSDNCEVQALVKSERCNKNSSFFSGINDASGETGQGDSDTQKKKASTAANVSDDIDSLNALTNSEIGEKLKGFGQKVGPIGPTTRQVYLKKLLKLLQNAEVTILTSEQYSDEEHADVIVPVTRGSSRRQTMQVSDHPPMVTRRSASNTNKRRSVAASSEVSAAQSASVLSSATRRRALRSSAIIEKANEPVVRSEETTVEKTKSDVSAPPSDASLKMKAIKPERRWIPVWVQIIITLLLVTFIYLVLQAMESNPRPLTLSSNDKSG